MAEALYHGTQTALAANDMLTPQGAFANGHRDHLSLGYVFATSHMGLAQEYAHGMPGGVTRECYVYEVEPVGQIEQDPADIEGSYRTREALRVVRLAAVRRVVRRTFSSGYTIDMHGRWEVVSWCPAPAPAATW
jgi:hypothetical protein